MNSNRQPLVAYERPTFSHQEALELVQNFYDINGTIKELPSERDQNFYLTCVSGEQFVLKIANKDEQKAVLDFQNQALAYLHERDHILHIPHIRLTTNGKLIATVPMADGTSHFVRLMSYLPGKLWANVKPHSPELLADFGRFLGRLDRAFTGFDHPAAHHPLKWDLQHATWIGDYILQISDMRRRAIAQQILVCFQQDVLPDLPSMRKSVIHNDANDYNVLVSPTDLENDSAAHVAGIIDFGDMVYTNTVCEVAIAAAYGILGQADPVGAATQIIGGYHSIYPLTEQELSHLFTLICMRLCVSVTNAANQQQLGDDDAYTNISEQPAWAALEKLVDVPPALAHYRFRQACSLAPCPQTSVLTEWLQANQQELHPLVDANLQTSVVLDLSVGSPLLARLEDCTDVDEMTAAIFAEMRRQHAEVGIGRYNEARQIYIGDLFQMDSQELPERRTIHIGLDLFMMAGTPIYAPLDGIVHSFHDNDAPLDYGPTIILEHTVADGACTFWTLYGHLSRESLEDLSVGMEVQKGSKIATMGEATVNGGWPPHLHFQLITDLLGCASEFSGVAAPSQREVWLSISPDPNLILGIPAHKFPQEGRDSAEILALRQEHLGKMLSVSYSQRPLKIVRGWRQYLYDESGHEYLDVVNNVCHIGHCHPRVVRAAQDQIAVLNTNTRYLHDNIVDYARRLTDTLPDPLNVCFLVCTGSEANDLALRLARTHTGRHEMICLDGAYHGNLNTLIEISPYKHDGRGGSGTPPHVYKVPMPDGYAGLYKYGDPDAGRKYASHVQEAVARSAQKGEGIAAFIAESVMGCGGQIVLPDGFLESAYADVRAAGGLCIADEVQVGFGRIGTHFWGFESQGVVPDIVTMGKPIGNGHPMAAVVTTSEIATSFNNGMEYFNTFGGNPVSCAIGLAVLDVIEEEKLQENALEVGAYLKTKLSKLLDKYPLVGDVRGIGFYIGIELVLNREIYEPAPLHAAHIAFRMREHGILVSTDGPRNNVLKMKPPIVFTRENADRLVYILDKVLAEDAVQLASC